MAADGAALGASPTTTVVVCAYTAVRWQLLTRALASLDSQSRRPAEVLLVIDHDDDLLRRARAAFQGTRVVASRGPRGLSGARNTGVELARGEVVAFLDDDASAHPDWLERLTRHYADPSVLGVGGQVRAAWACGRAALRYALRARPTLRGQAGPGFR